MAEINPAVIAGAGSSIAGAAAPDLKQIITMQALAQRMQLLQQEQQGQNALKALYGNPANISQQTGEPTPQAMNQLMSVAPQVGLDFQSTILKNREAQQRAALLGTKVRDDNRAWALQTIAAPAVARYREVLQATGSKDQAQAAAQQVFGENRERAMADGRLSPDEQRQVPNNFSLSQAETNLLGVQGVRDAERKDRAEQRAERSEARQDIAEGRHQEVATSTIQHQRAIEDAARVKQSASAEAELAPDVRKTMAEQYLAGDKTVMQNIGRGAQGAKNIVLLRGEIARQAAEAGMSGRDIAAKMAEFAGLTAGERTLGTRTANIEMAVTEAQKLIPLALEASSKVDRTQFPALNSLLQSAEKGTGGEEVVRLGIAVNSLINTYARAISPTGVPTVSDKDHARELLSAAWSKGQFAAGVDQLNKELEAARTSPGAVRAEFRGAVSAAPGKQAAPEPGAPGPSGTFTPPGGARATLPSAAAPKPAADGIFAPKSEEDYSALPSGAAFRKPGDPPDKIRIKP